MRWVAPAAHGENSLPDHVCNENIACEYRFRFGLFDGYTNLAKQKNYDERLSARMHGIHIHITYQMHLLQSLVKCRGRDGSQHCSESMKLRDLIQPCTPPESQSVESTRLCTWWMRSQTTKN